MEQRRYVSTDRDGRSQTAAGVVVFDVPRQGEAADGAFPSAPSQGASAVVELRSPEGLLDALGERIFAAEAVGGSAPEDGPVVRAASARLVAETAWDDERAARFALECAEHALRDEDDVALPHGRTLGGVLADVRAVLDRAHAPTASLGWLGRFAALRRLRRDGAAVSDLAMLAAKEDEGAGIDLLDDPAWTSLAAISEAVLACAEALRYLAHPHHVATREELDERDADDRPPSQLHVEETPWGWVALGAERVPAHRPAAACAEQAAERARQSVADTADEASRRRELVWQAERLAALLEGDRSGA